MARLPFDSEAITRVIRALEKLVEQPGRSRQLGVRKGDVVYAIDALESALEAHAPSEALNLNEERCTAWWEGK